MGTSLQLSEVQQQQLRQAIQDGLPLTPQPYQTLATALGVSESAVMQTLTQWMDDGLIKRFGLVVKHHALGYRSNAMVVWDVPDHQVDQIGQILSQADAVTLCYQRPRRLPEWRYNLFTMIHGKSRSMVMEQLAELIVQHELDGISRDVLFSYRLFKQCGGHYSGRSQPVNHVTRCHSQQTVRSSCTARSSRNEQSQVAYG
ncbi:siroheme decarboxylase subunit beta [Litoribrevibacter albus]|uniref:siroheme decarboxylase n=1 Tax=Litoribrevibacter albus TaxID=1473156 RepID=A0AA37W568_9GAMM|nr:AsnC family protein [Litoribrevibacter albus]GLQ30897.1 protein NirL [Litoribrevibacter albus]